MSALTTPFIHTAHTVGGASEPVNAEQVLSIGKTTIDPNSSAGSRATYEIVFQMADHGANPKEIRWRYETEEDRDNDYEGILVIVSTEVVPAS